MQSTDPLPGAAAQENGASAARASRQTRVLWIAIGVLALVNIVTLVFLWSHRPHPMCNPGECPDQACTAPGGEREERGPHGPGGAGPQGAAAFDFIAHETHMDRAQIRAYENLRDQHQMAVRPLRDSLHDLREQLFQQLANGDEARRLQQLRTVAELSMKQDSITVRHFQQVRALLHPDQQQRFDSIITEATRMMAPPPHGPEGAEGEEEMEDGPPPVDAHHAHPREGMSPEGHHPPHPPQHQPRP